MRGQKVSAYVLLERNDQEIEISVEGTVSGSIPAMYTSYGWTPPEGPEVNIEKIFIEPHGKQLFDPSEIAIEKLSEEEITMIEDALIEKACEDGQEEDDCD
jgi:hypothetical protein